MHGGSYSSNGDVMGSRCYIAGMALEIIGFTSFAINFYIGGADLRQGCSEWRFEHEWYEIARRARKFLGLKNFAPFRVQNVIVLENS